MYIKKLWCSWFTENLRYSMPGVLLICSFLPQVKNKPFLPWVYSWIRYHCKHWKLSILLYQYLYYQFLKNKQNAIKTVNVLISGKFSVFCFLFTLIIKIELKLRFFVIFCIKLDILKRKSIPILPTKIIFHCFFITKTDIVSIFVLYSDQAPQGLQNNFREE